MLNKKRSFCMKKMFIILILFNFTHCNKDFSPLWDIPHVKTKYFDPQKLPMLRLDSLEYFWQGDTITHKSNYITEIFNRNPSFLDALRYSCRGRGGVGISVFKSQADAFKMMRERIDDVAGVIYNGNSNNKIKDIWWYAKWLPAIFINHNNTIIETYIFDYNYDKVKDLLIETALEISKRMEDLSE